MTLRQIGIIRSSLTDCGQAPRQGDEGAPDAWIELESGVASGLEGMTEGDDLVVLTWFHLSDREVLKVHPRNDPSIPERGVFTTRSPDRPNPIGLHRVTVRHIEGARLLVGPIEAIDGTPVVDIKLAMDRLGDD